MAQRTLDHPKIEVLWDTVVEEVLGVDQDAVHAVRIKNTKTQEAQELPCKGVFVAIGHIPNTAAFKNILKLDDEGYIIPETNSMVKTSTPGLYAAGDCVDHVYRQAITAAGMGCQAAIELERWLANKEAQVTS